MKNLEFKDLVKGTDGSTALKSLRTIQTETDEKLSSLGPLARVAADWRLGKIQREYAERSAKLLLDAKFEVGAYKTNLAVRDDKDAALAASRSGRLHRSEETVVITGKFADSISKIEIEEARSTVRLRWAYLKALAEETQNGTIDSQGAELLAEIIEEAASDTISVWRNLRRSAIASEFEKANQSFKSDSHR